MLNHFKYKMNKNCWHTLGQPFQKKVNPIASISLCTFYHSNSGFSIECIQTHHVNVTNVVFTWSRLCWVFTSFHRNGKNESVVRIRVESAFIEYKHYFKIKLNTMTQSPFNRNKSQYKVQSKKIYGNIMRIGNIIYM